MRDQGVAESLGKRVRRARQERGLTLREIESRSKVSATHVSEVERGKTSPTVGVLDRISAALGVSPGVLLEPVASMPPLRRSAGSRRRRTFTDTSAVVEGLTHRHGPSELSVLLVTVAPGGLFQDENPHPGEEFCYVLEGAAEVLVGEIPHVVTAGEAIHFRSAVAHAIRNATRSQLRFLWACRPRVAL